MIILSVVPKDSKVGYCVFNNVPLEHGSYFLSSDSEKAADMAMDRLSQFVPRMISIIDGYGVQAITVRQVTGGLYSTDRDPLLSVQTAMRTLAISNRIPYVEQNPVSVKRSFVGGGSAGRSEISSKVKERWGLEGDTIEATEAVMVATVASGIPLSDSAWRRWDKFFRSEGEF